jgi:hypothetical protein
MEPITLQEVQQRLEKQRADLKSRNPIRIRLAIAVVTKWAETNKVADREQMMEEILGQPLPESEPTTGRRDRIYRDFIR